MTATNVLTVSARLGELEAVIKRGFETFVEVGNALREIRDTGLYKERGFSTFEAYTQEHWKMARRTAYNKMAAAEVAENVVNVPLGAQNMPNYKQAVELSRLEPEQQREIARTTEFSKVSVWELTDRIKQARKAEVRELEPAEDSVRRCPNCGFKID